MQHLPGMQLLLLWIVKAVTCTEVLLHKPTGPYHVTQTQHVFNHTTPDDFTAPNGTGIGTIMLVSIFAPTLSVPNQTVPYLDDTNAAIWESALGFPPSSLSSLVTELQWQAPVLSGPEFSNATSPYPSILFMPGAGLSCLFYTAYLSELASWGYSVFAIDHPGEPPYIELPYFGGGVRSAYPPLNSWTYDQFQSIYAHRLSDAAALLSPSYLPALVHSFGAPFNISTLNVFGHSIGGAAAAGIMAKDPSLPLVAGANLDGWYWFDYWDLYGNGTSDAPYPNLARPFLELARENPTEPDAAWTNFSAVQSAWLRDVGVRGAEHLDFSDIPLWVDLLGQRNSTPDGFVGSINGGRVTEIVNTLLKTFFGHVGGDEVDDVVKSYPEVWVREALDSTEDYGFSI